MAPTAWKLVCERGALLIDCTSGDPGTSRRIARRAGGTRRRALPMLPVSGGVSGAEAGTLTVMVGGDERPSPGPSRCCPRSENGSSTSARRRRPRHEGGQQRAARGESHRRGRRPRRAGQSRRSARTAVDVLNASSGRSFVSESLVPERVLTGRWPRTFRLALLDKDVGIACTFLDEVAVEGPILDLAGQLLSEARTRVGRGGGSRGAHPTDRAPGRRRDPRLTFPGTCRDRVASFSFRPHAPATS